jgi:CIC family chloride channel protein
MDRPAESEPTPADSGKASNRHSSVQPNVPGQGIVAGYSKRFWGLVVAVGVGAGLGGALLTVILRAVEHASYGYHAGTLLDGATHADAQRHLLILLLAGVVAGVVGLLIAHVRGSGAGEISEALWIGDGHLSFWKSNARGLLSIVVVGMGASLGREGAPQLAGAALASTLSEWAGVPKWQRRLLVASGAGAGMAAVYNVPLGGALFACEVLLGTLALPLVLPALAVSLIATCVAWIAVPDHPTYHVPVYPVSASQIALAAVIGPLAGLCAVGWVRAIALVNTLKPQRWGRVVAPIVVFTALGAVSIAYPQLLGNGKDVVQLAFNNRLAVGVLIVLLVLKPLASAACLGSGAPGGLFTPTLALGAVFGGVVGHGWAAIFPGGAVGSYAIIGGAAVLAASMQGPLAAVVLVLELTHTIDGLMVPILLAVTEATIIARLLGAPSIYSARLNAAEDHKNVTIEDHADLVPAIDMAECSPDP